MTIVDPLLDQAVAMHLLRQMLFIRRFEERCAQLYSAEKIRGFLHLYIGQEAIATGVSAALAADDVVFATYREHGHALTRGVDPGRVMAEMFGKREGVSGGRGGSMHLFDVEHGFYGGSAIVAGHLPMAIGVGLADRMRDRKRVTTCFFGEGAVAEGAFHESMNLAALWRCPVLFCCENNLYAMGTAIERSESQTSLTAKAASYNVPAQSIDGMDVLKVVQAARRAVGAIRAGNGPYFLEFRTYRFRAHSMFDPQRYRAKAEVDDWKQRDPIERFDRRLRDWGFIDDAGRARMNAEVEAEVEAAVAFAEAGTVEPVDQLTRHVVAEAP